MRASFDIQPMRARTRTCHDSVGPVAFDWVKFVVVRDGFALVCSKFGERFANVDDVLLTDANVLCEARPEGHLTMTVISLDTDYELDQFF